MLFFYEFPATVYIFLYCLVEKIFLDLKILTQNSCTLLVQDIITISFSWPQSPWLAARNSKKLTS